MALSQESGEMIRRSRYSCSVVFWMYMLAMALTINSIYSVTGQEGLDTNLKTNFTLYESLVTWSTARKACQERGSILLEMSNPSKYDLIGTLVSQEPRESIFQGNNFTVWTGLYRTSSLNGVYIWTNSCSVEPDLSIGDSAISACVVFNRHTLAWTSENCDAKHMFICEMPTADSCGFYRQNRGIPLWKFKNADHDVASLEACENKCNTSNGCNATLFCGGLFMTGCMILGTNEVASLTETGVCTLSSKRCQEISVSSADVVLNHSIPIEDHCAIGGLGDTTITSMVTDHQISEDKRNVVSVNSTEGTITTQSSSISPTSSQNSSAAQTNSTNTKPSPSDRVVYMASTQTTKENEDVTDIKGLLTGSTDNSTDPSSSATSITPTSSDLPDFETDPECYPTSGTTSRSMDTTADVGTSDYSKASLGDPFLSSTTVVTSEISGTLPESKLQCTCPCTMREGFLNLTEDELEDFVEEILKSLEVNASSLSSTRRKYICAEDNRPSARYTGYLGSVLLLTTIVFITASDLVRVVLFGFHQIQWLKNTLFRPNTSGCSIQ